MEPSDSFQDRASCFSGPPRISAITSRVGEPSAPQFAAFDRPFGIHPPQCDCPLSGGSRPRLEAQIPVLRGHHTRHPGEKKGQPHIFFLDKLLCGKRLDWYIDRFPDLFLDLFLEDYRDLSDLET
jgi:hypothetical protein